MFRHLKMKLGFVVSLALSVASVNAMSVTEALMQHIPQACSNDCAAWSQSVGPCLENINGPFVVSADPKNITNPSFQGEFQAASACLCNEDAFAAAESCLACANYNLCMTAENGFSVGDYRNLCTDPWKTGKALFSRWHPEIAHCDPSCENM